jgi:hypothetical protein
MSMPYISKSKNLSPLYLTIPDSASPQPDTKKSKSAFLFQKAKNLNQTKVRLPFAVIRPCKPRPFTRPFFKERTRSDSDTAEKKKKIKKPWSPIPPPSPSPRPKRKSDHRFRP